MYVDLAGLSRYKQNFDAWARGALLPEDAAFARVRTAKAGAVSFVPVQRTPLDVFVDFLFSETPPASGDKGPENPSTITGVGSVKVTRCGKNVLPSNYVHDTMTPRGVTVTRNQDGSFHLKGTVTDNLEAYLTFFSNAVLGVVPNPIGIGKTLTISVVCSDSNVYGALYKSPSTSSWGSPMMIYAGTPVTYTMPDDVKSAMFRIIATRGSTLDCDVHVQIEYGQTATEWEAPADTDYTVPLGGTYYGGTLDVASGAMTVTMQYMVADSNADIVWIGTNFVAWRYPAGLNCIGRAVGTEVCSHFPFNGAWDGSFAHFYATPSSGLYFANPNWTASTYRQYFTDQYNNGTPVTACYQLATPLTVQLTPTQILSLSQPDPYTPRINTVYSDAQAVQAGYLKNPSAASSELRNALVSLGGGI